MKKFLAVFDGFRLSKGTMDYAIQISKIADAYLVGVFLDEFLYRSYSTTKVLKQYGNYEQMLKELDAKDKKKREESTQQFQKSCGKAGIHYSIHHDEGYAINDLKKESMFADLIIINEFETFTKYQEGSPTQFMKDLLRDVQCPVLVVPNSFKPFDKVVLLYDGGPSSLHAIKMFSYLLGGKLDLPVEVLTIKDNYMATTRLPDNKLMREFVKRHFPKATFTVAKGDPEEQIIGHIRNHKEIELVVLGAYRRSELSRWFKTSMADVLMKELDSPLFIAHNK